MARKMMSKEVTKTTVKIAVMEVGENGLPVAKPLEDVVLLGNVSAEKAQKTVSKMFEEQVTVFGVEANTQTYVMDVEKFIQLAELKNADSDDEII